MNLLEFVDSKLQEIAKNKKCELLVRFHMPTNSMVILFSEVDLMLEIEVMSFMQNHINDFKNQYNKTLLVSSPKLSQQHTQIIYELDPNLIDIWANSNYK